MTAARTAQPDTILVNLYNDPDGAPYATDVPLSECFPDDPEALAQALNAIETQGQVWTGGGAGQPVFIARA